MKTESGTTQHVPQARQLGARRKQKASMNHVNLHIKGQGSSQATAPVCSELRKLTSKEGLNKRNKVSKEQKRDECEGGIRHKTGNTVEKRRKEM